MAIHDESEELKIAESSSAERFNPLTDFKKYGKQMDDFAEDVANGFINKDYRSCTTVEKATIPKVLLLLCRFIYQIYVQ
ncbi:MAG: hypothetical protein K6B18_14485 [Ruminococcus sp.]|nr:hypothetical protein [Ruminococcus sp.]